MGSVTLSPDNHLESMADIWGNMVLWAFAMTTTIYVTVGICWALCLRVKKSVSVVLPLAFLGFGELKVLFGDVIACAFVAGIYVTTGWTMTSLAAFGWGVGLSLASILLTVAVSWVPIYAFL